MDRRAAEQAAAAVAEEQKKKRTLSTGSALEKVQSRMDRPSALRKLGRGRAVMNAPMQMGGSVQTLEKRKSSLTAAAEYRPTAKVMAVAPAGSGRMDNLPDRMDFEVGTAAGAAAFTAEMLKFLKENFDSTGIEARSADEHEKKAGFFGYWHKHSGHGKCVEPPSWGPPRASRPVPGVGAAPAA